MKKTKTTLLYLLIITFFAVGCKKEGPVGPEGPQGPAGNNGPDAKTFTYSLTFNPGDNYKSYGGITGFDANDVIITYGIYEYLSGTAYYVQLPAVVGTVNFLPEFSETSGYMFMNTVKADGSAGSPWSSTATIGFKSVLIKSSARIRYPDLDLSNYEEVKRTFKLED